MPRSRFSISRLDAGLLAAACLLLGTALAAGQLPLQPPKEAGEAITPAYEGWFPNEDGSYSLLIGYFNRNTKQIIDIPIGPNNRIEPGGPDMGQPTHFLLRRQWGVFTIRVPADFGTKKYTWTIVANGKPASIPLGLTKDYQVEPYKEVAQGNTPPKIKFTETGKEFTGPPRNGFAATMTATTGTPLTLTAWVSDDLRVDPDDTLTPPAAAPPAAAPPAATPPAATPPGATPPAAAGGRGGRGGAAGRGGFGAQPPVRLVWTHYRGPGDVTFENATPAIDIKGGGKATTTATFSAPGEYWLRAQVNDRSGDGGGGFQCCWTNAHVKVTVTGAATSK